MLVLRFKLCNSLDYVERNSIRGELVLLKSQLLAMILLQNGQFFLDPLTLNLMLGELMLGESGDELVDV